MREQLVVKEQPQTEQLLSLSTRFNQPSFKKEIETIPQAFLQSATKHSDNPCLIYKKDHTFGLVTYKRLLNLVENFTVSLKQLGVKQGDRVAILSENRPEWVISDLSVTSLRAMFIPIHTTLSPEQTKDIVLELEPKIIIVSEKRLLSKLIKIKKEIERRVILLYYNIELKDDLTEFRNDKCHFIEALKMLPHKNHSEFYRKLIDDIHPNDTASIIYTISPSGKYRGVELSHKNFIENIKGASENVLFKPEDRFLSVLPLSHAFEKTAGYYMPIMQGASIAYLSDITKFSNFTREYKPSVIIGVPRVYEKSYEKIRDQVNHKRFFKRFLNKALNSNGSGNGQTKMKHMIYDRLIYKNIRKSMGGNLRFMISGGAGLNPKVGKFFDKCGIPILEGYGLTEFAPIVSVNKPDQYKNGTVGFPVANAQVKIADDGEILIKGPSVMKGYYGNGSGPQLDLDNGWFRTGDLGEFDDEGFLKILGRKKEIIVLSNGKNVSPIKIEEQITKSKYIKQAAVFGNEQKFLVALIVPDFKNLKNQFSVENISDLIENKEIIKFFQQIINKKLHNFAKHEQIKKLVLINSSFTNENGFLNNDLTKNRLRIAEFYQNIIDNLRK